MTIAKYIRLSDADEDLGAGEKAESDSVANQRLLLDAFIAASPEFAGCRIAEFVDDGRSGVNFNRPGFRALMEAAGRGELGCVVVKDLSRLARSHLDAGDCLERVFPSLGVRFISVNDRYDSARMEHGTAGSLDAGVRNLINELYSREISQKVRQARRQYAERGLVTAAYPFYGYVKAPADRRRLEPDPAAARVVAEIFSLFLNGNTTGEIAAILNGTGAPTPTERKRQLGARRGTWSAARTRGEWTRETVRRILRDERYAGKLIANRRVRRELGDPHSVVPQKRSDWIVAPGAFAPLVSQEEYDAAQALFRKTAAPAPAAERPAFYRKLRCGVCALAPVRRGGAEPYYRCAGRAWNAAEGCGRTRIREDDLTRAVLCSIRWQARLALCAAPEAQARRAGDAGSAAKREDRRLERKAGRLAALKKEAYLRYDAGELTREGYEALRARLDADTDGLRARLGPLGRGEDRRDPAGDGARTSALERLCGLEKLDYETVDRLIRCVRIYGGGRIEIVWRFADPWAAAGRAGERRAME